MKSIFLKHKIVYTVLVLILSIFVSCSSDDEVADIGNETYITIPDKHFEAILVEQNLDSDGIINQKILKEDAKKVTRLNLNLNGSFGETSDLTGIEAFSNLTFLSAAGQKIETIDLSSNTKLDTLYLNANYLTTIDISNNPNLTLVDIHANDLTSFIGLAKATKLKGLNLSYNFLTKFSVTNESLETLMMSNNLLTSFDAENALNLKSAILTSNKITSINTNTSLETLLISDNKITAINISTISNLKYLYITSNSLTNLDVSNNLKLEDLRVDRNPDLACIKINADQTIPTIYKSDSQKLSDTCF
ncbi:hypothetical protein C7448_109105 [Tenacibaculum gallaicum]|uniref:Leucine rich repeat (LRR) protein n=1 Tax=Tenacibaculum gallaicum TaxID=561505 RepID=A0A3E0HHJ7_9FLAO|nr:hypothetical protein [Tenacibaculum gallaicum]REH45852.1 hypothetical protein C7448_109105 [Tenacibaculum gallaicum]